MLLRSMFLAVLISYCQVPAIGQDLPAHTTSTVYPSVRAKKYKLVLNTNITLTAYSLDSLKGNTLYITGKAGPQEVSTDIIRKLQVARKQKHTFTIMAIGAGVGALTGAIIGYATYQEPEPDPWGLNDVLYLGPEFNALVGGGLGMVAGLSAGAIIGSSFRWLHYDFTTVPPSERAAMMGPILSGQTH